MDIRGHTVHRVWIEEASDIAKEYYASITFDRGRQAAAGDALGRWAAMDIEEVARTQPEALVRLHIDPLIGFQPHDARSLAYGARHRRGGDRRRGQDPGGLYDAFVGLDAMLMEINPLVLTEDGRVVALDAKVTIDGNAAVPPRRSWRRSATCSPEDPQERMAQERGRHLRQARRRRRHPGQRGRPGDEHPRRGGPGGRPPRQLPGRRRRLEGRRRGHRPRGAALRRRR